MHTLLEWLHARPLRTALIAAALLFLHVPAALVLGTALLLLAYLNRGRPALALPFGLAVALTWLLDATLSGRMPGSIGFGGGQPLMPWEWPIALALLCAALLHGGRSWNVVLITQLLLVSLAQLLLLRLSPEALSMEAMRLSALVRELWQESGIEQLPPTLEAPLLAALLAASAGLLALFCLVLARYWQALLFNPGGFGKEFRNLRLPPWLLLPLCLLWLAAAQQGWREWFSLSLPTLLFASAALGHGAVAAGRLSGAWLGVHYGIMVVVPVVAITLLALDGVFNFRQRLAQARQNDETPPTDQSDNHSPDSEI